MQFGLTRNMRETGASPAILLCCRADNDLYRVVNTNGFKMPRYDTPADAIAGASRGAGVLILADGYPKERTTIDQNLLIESHKKDLRLYVEFPDTMGEKKFTAVQRTKRERMVIRSDFFGESLKPMRILAVHDCHFVPASATECHIVAAVVAGYDTAVFGLPVETYPILFELDKNTLVATTKFSQFVTGRYGPRDAWQTIWGRILAWVSRGNVDPTLTWTPLVRPMYGPDEKLPADYEKRAFDRAVEWHYKSRLFVHSSLDKNRGDIEGALPMPPAEAPDGDGMCGIAEGYRTQIAYDGNQLQAVGRRSDNQAQTAMIMALAWKLNQREKDRVHAKNLMDYIYFLSNLQQGPSADPKHPLFGQIMWFVERPDCYLTAECRPMTNALTASVLLDSDRWDERHLRYMLAVERVVGKDGFGSVFMSGGDITSKGWRYYSEGTLGGTPEGRIGDIPATSFMMAYRLTGHEPFLIKAKRNLTYTMSRYPDGLIWFTSISGVKSCMSIALAWLVRMEDTPQHREWMHRIIKDLLAAAQVSCGAILEDFGGPGRGAVTIHGAYKSNEEYGTREGPLYQQNGDPNVDFLYCQGFALLALHEAYAATGDAYLKEAEDKLAEFICRAQVRSERFPYLDGAWFRSFDLDKWEYWGSSADNGWGGWSVETGWGLAYSMLGLALRQMNTSLWDICARSNIKAKLPKVLDRMKQNDGSPYLRK